MTNPFMEAYHDVLVSFTVVESDGRSRVGEPITFGVPLGSGALESVSAAQVIKIDGNCELLDSKVVQSSLWPDGSVKWLIVTVVISVQQAGASQFSLVKNQNRIPRESVSKDSEKSLKAAFNLAVEKRDLESISFLPVFKNKKTAIALKVSVKDASGNSQYVEFENPIRRSTYAPSIGKTDFNSRQLVISGRPVKLSLSVTLHKEQMSCEVVLALHNPSAAIHKKGIWDLGDVNSVGFEKIAVEIFTDEKMTASLNTVEVNRTDALVVNETESFKVFQYSSGGDNDHSDVHVDHTGTLPFAKSGYEVYANGALLKSGRRCEPNAVIACEDLSVCVRPKYFWQTFPSSIEYSNDVLNIGLFGSYDKGMHELQPGERASKVFRIEFAAKNEFDVGVLKPMTITKVEGKGLAKSLLGFSLNPVSELDLQSQDWISSPSDFIGKREVVDEYGWRNFGDVFADHESLYTDNPSSVVESHYNNQYDLILGFGLQYMRTRDSAWLDLMNELAEHYIQIDTYATEGDRAEYNRGVFWHTNHYEKAETATHRTYSRKNYNPEQPLGSSGGPGAEHCYTTGLALHYFLQGDQRSADTVVSLARWIEKNLNGDDCVLARLHSIAKKELPRIAQLLKGNSVPASRYPFTRGTGNFLRACVDAFEVTNEAYWLKKADEIVSTTFHFNDDIEKRNLDDIEGTWFHTIYLQEVVRYMIMKVQQEQIDECYEHARLSMSHYLGWMLENAQPYLTRPEQLEFANDTWAAQDIRRYYLMLVGARLGIDNDAAFSSKATDFYSDILKRFETSDTLYFTRIQAILMQNIYRLVDVDGGEFPKGVLVSEFPSHTSIRVEIVSALRQLWKALVKLKLGSEIRWIRTRL